jgi:hypothetical protein
VQAPVHLARRRAQQPSALFPHTNEAWKRVVELMLEISDVAIIDLSSASPNLAWELELGRSRYPAPRLIDVVDRRASLRQLRQYYQLRDTKRDSSIALIRYLKNRIAWIPLALSVRRAVVKAVATPSSIRAAEQLVSLAGHVEMNATDRDRMREFFVRLAPRFRFGETARPGTVAVPSRRVACRAPAPGPRSGQ